jgi:hypothetical protein
MASADFPSGIFMTASAHVPQQRAERGPTQYLLMQWCGHGKQYEKRARRIAIFRPVVRPVAPGGWIIGQNRRRGPACSFFALEHDPEKWMPVFRKDHAPTKKLDHDPVQFDRIMV